MFARLCIRHAIVLTVWLSVLIVILWSLMLSSLGAKLSDVIATTWLQHGEVISTDSIQLFNTTAVSDMFTQSGMSRLNRNVGALSACSQKPNQFTNAIRLPGRIQNISLTPPGKTKNGASRHFNPAIISLPPYSPFPYLLLTRSVTAGLHQESHICFVSLCVSAESTTSKTLPPDSRSCDESDLDVLGPQGGLRCATAPDKLDIPPTPTRSCEGAWSAFPDIPGFHDPRMFWSGKGEPLVMVNSASSYGCVGLWVVDLRAVYPELDDLLSKKGRYAGLRHRDEVAQDAIIPAPTSYPYLTELTKNPRSARDAVEKNWIMFFPKNDESWIQYDLVAHGTREVPSNDNMLLSLNISQGALEASFRSENTTMNESTSGQTGAPVKTSARFDLEEILHGVAERRKDIVDTKSNHSTENAGRARRSELPVTKLQPILKPARTLAKLVGSGYTTPNLTAVDESPCLTSTDLLDNTGRKGHWHQGSNSLRMVLCRRHDLACLADHDQGRLVDDGKVVHFSVLHRKFNNEMELPMRYERYFMVWEARPPFRMVGITRHPILFAGEKASPWSNVENQFEEDGEAERWEAVYFTYTPSLAWAWRRDKAIDSLGRARTLYGTGYLDDEVVVGIGMDDIGQGFVKVKAEDLVSCLRLCPDIESQEEA